MARLNSSCQTEDDCFHKLVTQNVVLNKLFKADGMNVLNNSYLISQVTRSKWVADVVPIRTWLSQLEPKEIGQLISVVLSCI
jgi:hypothetical protein